MSPPRKKAFMVWENVLTPAELDAIEQLGDALILQRAELATKGDVNPDIRSTRTAWIEPGPESRELYERIAGIVQHLNREIYRYEITGLEALQYTVYHDREGGHYDWHIDYGPDNPRPRKISLSIQLSEAGAYEGCELQFQVGPKVGVAPKTRGAVIAFPSFLLHRVTPITSGTRKALVVWATGPEFR